MVVQWQGPDCKTLPLAFRINFRVRREEPKVQSVRFVAAQVLRKDDPGSVTEVVGSLSFQKFMNHIRKELRYDTKEEVVYYMADVSKRDSNEEEEVPNESTFLSVVTCCMAAMASISASDTLIIDFTIRSRRKQL